MTINPIPAFQSNYLWSIENLHSAALVDPGDAAPVLSHLKNHNLTLKHILITHHHPDHVGGIRQLKKHFPDCQVFGPATENIPMLDTPLSEGDEIDLDELGKYKILDIPGHTSGHIAYYDQQNAFVGDTIFAAGCGRLFEGTAEQMVRSFHKIKQLPLHTKLFCAHEYTLSNIDFALTIEPDNIDLQNLKLHCEKLRQNNKPTVPTTLQQELATNPFLRCHLKNIQEVASRCKGANINDEVSTFAVIRSQKDSF